MLVCLFGSTGVKTSNVRIFPTLQGKGSVSIGNSLSLPCVYLSLWLNILISCLILSLKKGLWWLHLPKLITCLRQKLCPLSDLLVFKRLNSVPADMHTHKSSHIRCQEKERKWDIAADTSSFFLFWKSPSPVQEGRLSVYLTVNSLQLKIFNTKHIYP